MCKKLPYCNPRIDECLTKIISNINSSGKYRTLSSCCGHNKYPKTIIVKNILTGNVFEYFSKIELRSKKRNRYYKKDNEGFYYVPEIII